MMAQDLKNSILQQAIQGKLTRQLPTDGNAKDLLEKIREEKLKLIAEGKLKKEKTLPPISEDEKPFDIPDSWTWAYIGDTCVNIQYGTSKKSQPSGKIPVLRMGNIQSGKINYDSLVYTSDESDILRCHLEKNDLLFNRTNSRELVGKTAIYKAEFPAIYAGYLVRITPIQIDSDYLNFVMQSPYFWKYCRKVKYDAIGQSNINAQKLKAFIFPLPPLEEQKRIVTKLEKILPLVEKFGELEQRLTKLDKEFPDKLKKSLLQQAIQGKLTRQLPTDGNAKALLEKIREEKLKLVAEGKLKKEKPLPPISEDEIPFDIPENWAWVRLGEIINLISGQDLTLDCHNTRGEGVPYITGASNIVGEKIMINRWTTSPTTTAEFGDLLLSCKGTVGKIAFLEESSAHIARQIMAIKISSLVDKFYIKFFVEKNVQNLKNQAKSMILGISRNNLLILPVPLPPLEEQKRIVAKLEELLPLCDRLNI